MDAHVTHSPFCPVCQQRTVSQAPRKFMRGLLTCQHCRESLVITWSGHYVRDPFCAPHGVSGGCRDVERTLRRTSHPMARFVRDLGLHHPQSLLLISTMLLLGTMLWMFKPTNPKPLPTENPPQTSLETSP
jgi:hypothetical protein